MSKDQLSVKTTSLESTLSLGSKLGQNLKGGEVIELASDLGGGKTSLVKGIVAGTGCSDLVSSPSFTICNQYQSPRFTIYHFDFYRLNDPGIIRRELVEVLGDKQAVVIIEWPSVIESALPQERLSISLNVEDEKTRDINFSFSHSLHYLVKGL